MSIIVLLLCGVIMPIIQVGGAPGGRAPGGRGGNDLPNPPQRPSINQPTARPTIAQPTARPSFTAQPTARPTFTAMPSFTTQPTARPTFTAMPTFSASFTRSIATSFFSSAFTGITITRTTQTSYTFNPTFTQTTTINYGSAYTYYWYPSMGFIHYGAGYSASTGSFTLGQTLYNQNNIPCLNYDYFEFNAPAGLTISARLWTTGPPINYIVVPEPVVSLLQSPTSCSAIGALAQSNTIGSTPYLYSWTAPQNGQYAIIFYSTTPYTAPIYFLPQ